MQPAPRISSSVVVVEDDDEMRELMVSELSDHSSNVVGVASAEALYRHLAVHDCDIVVLDVGLPGEDGYSVARHLRRKSDVGIVMLTARGGSRDMVRGLETGADLYLAKPVDMDVLIASLVSLARRLGDTTPVSAAIPVRQSPLAWALGADGWNLHTPQGNSIPLGEGERAFLQPLFATPGRPVERETLIQAISGEPWNFDPHRLEVLLHRLRSRVRAQCGLTLPVRAVRGVGYLFASDTTANG